MVVLPESDVETLDVLYIAEDDALAEMYRLKLELDGYWVRVVDLDNAVAQTRARRLTGREFLRLALVALAYWLAAKLSLNLALVHGQVTPIWPPTGIALVAILLVGRRAAAAIALAAFAVNLPIGPSVLGAAVIAAGNTLAPLLSAELLRRLDFHLAMDRLFDAIAITLAALTGMAVT